MHDTIKRQLYEWFWWVHRNGAPMHWRQEDTIVRAYGNGQSLRILSLSRWKFYKRGIDHRLKRLAAQYGVPEYVTIGRGDLVVDIGANVGEFSLYGHRLGARVLAIEPDPYTLACLRDNVSQTDVKIIEYGVGEIDGPVPFYVESEGANSSLVGEAGAGSTVEVRRLDTILSDLPGKIRLIKCDAEGGEPEVLRGAVETLKRTEFVSLECGYERGKERTLEACEAILKDAGFEIVRRQETGRCNLIARNPASA